MIDPHGKLRYYKESRLDSVVSTDSGWLITEHTGYMQIPAFAEAGTWVIRAEFHGAVIFSETHTIYEIPVSEGTIFDSLNAPVYFILSFPPFIEKAYAINLTILSVSFILFFTLILAIAIWRWWK